MNKNMHEKIKIGIIGLGRSGYDMQCNELDEKKDKFEIVAGCDTYSPWCDRMKERYPNCRLYGLIDDILKDPAVELVSIATRSVDHFDHAVLALRVGKMVLIDKPMCINAEQAIQLQAMAHRSKGSLFIRHNRRFDPDFLHIKEIMGSGLLGFIHTIKLSRLGYSRRSDWQVLKQNGGGQLLNWGPHLIDHALQLTGATQKPLKNIWSHCKRLIAGGDCEDHVKIILKSADDCIVDIEISGAAMISVPEYMIIGTRGSLIASLKKSQIELTYLDPLVELREVNVNNGIPGAYLQRETGHLKWIHETRLLETQPITDFWDELYKALKSGNEFPVTLDEAVEVMRVISIVKHQNHL